MLRQKKKDTFKVTTPEGNVPMGGESAFKRTYSWNFKIHKTDVQYVIFSFKKRYGLEGKPSLTIPEHDLKHSSSAIDCLGPGKVPIAEGP
jgi:hypothetical protein